MREIEYLGVGSDAVLFEPLERSWPLFQKPVGRGVVDTGSRVDNGVTNSEYEGPVPLKPEQSRELNLAERRSSARCWASR